MSDTTRLNRRELLRKTGLAGAGGLFPMILTSPVLGAKGVPPASDRIRIGQIGVRNRGGQNLKALMKHTVAVCDVDRDVLAAAKARVEKETERSCESFTDYRRLLERSDIDAVVISTPDHWHALMTVHACQAGKDVYCEKPLSLTVREGRAMVKAARRYGRVVQTGSQQRSDEKFREACEMVRSGRIGKLRSVKVGIPGNNFRASVVPDSEPPPELDYDMWLGPAPRRPYNVNRVHYNFRFFWDYSGGQMTNWGAHHLDIAQWALGMDESGPISVEGTCSRDEGVYYEVPDRYDLTYRFGNGAVVYCGTEHRGGCTFEGDLGTIHVNRGRLEVRAPEVRYLPVFRDEVRLYESEDHYRNWLECIRTRERPICDVETGHRSATLCHLGNIAARTGRKLTWDPLREQVLGDREQERMLHYEYRAPWKL